MSGIRRVGCVFLFWAGLASAAESPPLGQLPQAVQPLHYALHFRIDPAAAGFSASADIQVKLSEPGDHLWLHAQGLDIDKLELRDANNAVHAATFHSPGDKGVARIDFGSRLAAQELRLHLGYHASYNSQLEGLFKTSRAGKPYIVSQMEPISARRAFPGFDEPRFKTPFDLTIDVPAGQQAVANTAQSAEQELADGWRRLRFRTTPKLPTYLLALAVGPWDIVAGKTIAASRWRDQPIPLRGIAPQGEGARLQEALASTPEIITALEDYFGYPYAFGKLDLLAAPDFSAGAMENPGLVIFRESLLLLDANTPTRVRRWSFEVNAHELAHQWFGDTVTMPWWDDLWLNEAFATWMEGRITGQLRPGYRSDLERILAAQRAMAADSLASARRVRQPIGDNGDIEGAFDSLTYGKGAAVLGMFEAWMGETVFRDGMRQYMRRHAFGNARSDDLIDALAQAGDQDQRLGKAMRSFLDQPGVPLVSSKLECSDDKATLTVSQQRYFPVGSQGDSKQLWGIPLCVRTGKGSQASTQCQLLDQPSAQIALDGGCPDWYLPNAQARGYYRAAMSSADLAKLTAVAGSLNEREQLAFVDMIKAGFERADVDATGVIAAIAQLAPAKSREVAFALESELVWIRQQLADAPTRGVLDAYVAGLYLPRLRELGYQRRAGESEDDALLRGALVELLARKVDNAEVRAELVRQGKAVLQGEGNGRLRFGAANYDLLGTVLAVTVQELGAPAIDGLLREIGKNSDASLRTSMVMALGATHDASQGERVREFALDEATKISETARLLGVHQAEPRNRAVLWDWFQRRYAKVVAHTPVFLHGDLPEMVSEGWCDAAQAKRVGEFFTRTTVAASGTAQGVQRAQEGILLCAARRERQGTTSLQRWAAARTAP